MDTFREDKRKEAETSEGPDSGMAYASDDPRRGSKTKHTDIKETETGSSRQMAKDHLRGSKEVSEVYAIN